MKDDLQNKLDKELAIIDRRSNFERRELIKRFIEENILKIKNLIILKLLLNMKHFSYQ